MSIALTYFRPVVTNFEIAEVCIAPLSAMIPTNKQPVIVDVPLVVKT